MSFLNPIFLFALLTVAVPLLIYLLNIKKPKTIRFSTLSFFDSLKTTALKRIRIKRWLLLALRCLTILLLVFAASRPFLPPEMGWSDQSQPKIIGILVDNSPSMNRIDQNGPYMGQAVEIAKELINVTEGDARFLMNVTNGNSLNLPVLSKAAALRRVEELEAVNSGNYLHKRLQSLKQGVTEAEEPNKLIYLVTDAQATTFQPPEEAVEEGSNRLHLQVITVGEADAVNAGFENVTLETVPGNSVNRPQLRAVIKNYGAQQVTNAFITMLTDNEQISQQSFNLAAEETAEFIFDIPLSEQKNIAVELMIEGDELTFDNHYYAAIRQPGVKNVLVIRQDRVNTGFNSYLQPLLDAASEQSGRFNTDFVAIGDLDAESVSDYNAIVLDGVREIPDYLTQILVSNIETGTGLLLLPAADGNVSSYNRFLEFAGLGSYIDIVGEYGSFRTIDRIAEPNEGHPLLADIFENEDEGDIRLNVPEIFYYYQIEPEGNDLPVLSNRTGSPMFVESRIGTGRIVYAAIGADPGWSNFPVKPFFAPFFFRTIDYLMQGERAELMTHTLGKNYTASLNNGAQNITIRRQQESVIPDIRQTYRGTTVSYPAEEWEPGWIEIVGGDQTILYGVNQDAMESELVTLSETELQNSLNSKFESVHVVSRQSMDQGMESELKAATFGREIWYWFILAAFILLVTESLVSRHYKVEN